MKPYALVTGASRGIGAAVARALAAEGFPILINFQKGIENARAVREEIVASGGTAELAQFDVRVGAEVQAWLEPRLDEGLEIGVLINNAGVARDAPFPTMTDDNWDLVTRTTLDGFFHVTRLLVMPMVRRRWGRIVNIASVSGVIGNRGQVNYSAAKAGLIGATRSLALELAKRNITVNAVAPGLIETDMLDNAPVDQILKKIPMRRLGNVAEVAALVRYLVNDEASYITGQVIGINGGLA